MAQVGQGVQEGKCPKACAAAWDRRRAGSRAGVRATIFGLTRSALAKTTEPVSRIVFAARIQGQGRRCTSWEHAWHMRVCVCAVWCSVQTRGRGAPPGNP